MERAPAAAPSTRSAAVLQVAEVPLQPRRDTPHQRGLQLQLLGQKLKKSFPARERNCKWNSAVEQGVVLGPN